MIIEHIHRADHMSQVTAYEDHHRKGVIFGEIGSDIQFKLRFSNDNAIRDMISKLESLLPEAT